jgi:uncharacterized protein YndB with AHSA1/START domain
MIPSLSVEADSTTPTIVMTRTFDAPRAVVFEAWTRPQHVARWWDPSGTPLAECEIDLRPGGHFRWINRGPSGIDHPFTGTYRDILPPERLVFTSRSSPSGPESVGTLILAEQAGKTMLTITIECGSVAERDAMLAMRVDAGTARTLENLADYLPTIDAVSQTQGSAS